MDTEAKNLPLIVRLLAVSALLAVAPFLIPLPARTPAGLKAFAAWAKEHRSVYL